LNETRNYVLGLNFKDVIFNVECINGTNFSDLIIGDNNNNVLIGELELDTLIGLRGNDTLDGGSSGEIGDWVDYYECPQPVIVNLNKT